MNLSRRGILIGTLAGGGLAVGYLLRPRSFPLPLEPGRGEVAFDAWIKIARDGVVTVAMPQMEMGQGISTILAQIVATELGADWRQVAIEPAPVSAHYANLALAARWAELWMPLAPGLAGDAGSAITRRWAEDNRFMATADGYSLAGYETPAREAAATVRAMLARAAADQWSVSWEECRAEHGFIVHGDKRESFALLAESAAAYDPPDPPPLLPAAAFEAVDADAGDAPLVWPRLDLPSKVDGTFLFAGDVRLPGMLYASIRHGPIGKSRVSRVDSDAAKGMTGFVSLVEGDNWVAAVATNWWKAEQVLTQVAPRFRASGRVETDQIEQALNEALSKGQAERQFETGDPDALLERDFSMVRRYDVAPALHGSLETATATARLANGKLELWIAAQAPESARQAAAKALGLDLRNVVLYAMPAGGSFDRRLEHDHAREVAMIAREVGKPVQLTWSRWQEHLHGWPRTPAAALMGARTDPDGAVEGWRARIAVPATAREFGRRLFGESPPAEAIAEVAGQTDPLAMEGSVPPYRFGTMAIEQVPVSIDLPTARLRGNAHGYTAFFNECFIDELAHAAHREPLSFRMTALRQDIRLAECLQRVAALANWGGGSDSSGQGLACHVIGNGRIAAVATVQRGERGVRVHRVAAVADIGRIVNLDIARQQIEGGLIFGLGLALGSATSYAEGMPSSQRLRDLNLPLLADCPDISVEFVESSEEPADPGELGAVVAAPAIANALFSATGLRFRRLPLLSEGL